MHKLLKLACPPQLFMTACCRAKGKLLCVDLDVCVWVCVCVCVDVCAFAHMRADCPCGGIDKWQEVVRGGHPERRDVEEERERVARNSSPGPITTWPLCRMPLVGDRGPDSDAMNWENKRRGHEKQSHLGMNATLDSKQPSGILIKSTDVAWPTRHGKWVCCEVD